MRGTRNQKWIEIWSLYGRLWSPITTVPMFGQISIPGFWLESVSVRQVVWRIVSLQIKCKQQPLSEEEENALNLNPVERKKTNCTIFLGYTSNMISAGVRDTIRFLVQQNMVSVQFNLFCKVNFLVQGYLATNRRCVQKMLNIIIHLNETCHQRFRL